MKFKLSENVGPLDFKRNLKDRSYEIENIESQKFIAKKSGLAGYLENGFSSFMVKKILVEETSSEVTVSCTIDGRLFVGLIFVALLIYVIQIGFLEMTKDIIFLSTAFPVLVLAAMMINLFAVLSTIRRDFKKSLKAR